MVRFIQVLRATRMVLMPLPSELRCCRSSLYYFGRLFGYKFISEFLHGASPNVFDLSDGFGRKHLFPRSGIRRPNKRFVLASVFGELPLPRLLSFQLAQSLGGTQASAACQVVRCPRNVEEGRNLREFPLQICLHVFVTKQKKLTPPGARPGPAAKVVLPVREVRHEFAANESADKVLHRIIVPNLLPLNAVVVHRYSNVTRIANDVDHLPITRVEIFVALQDSWSGTLEQHLVRPEIDCGDSGLDIRK